MINNLEHNKVLNHVGSYPDGENELEHEKVQTILNNGESRHSLSSNVNQFKKEISVLPLLNTLSELETSDKRYTKTKQRGIEIELSSYLFSTSNDCVVGRNENLISDNTSKSTRSVLLFNKPRLTCLGSIINKLDLPIRSSNENKPPTNTNDNFTNIIKNSNSTTLPETFSPYDNSAVSTRDYEDTVNVEESIGKPPAFVSIKSRAQILQSRIINCRTTNIIDS